jgi:hypothetical protein
MKALPSALAFLLMIFAGWVNRQQLIAIEYLKAENECCASGRRAGGFALATPSGRCWQGKPRRWVAQGAARTGHHRDTRHRVAMASSVDRPQVRF